MTVHISGPNGPKRWENNLGQVRWQPVDECGRAKWYEKLSGYVWDENDDSFFVAWPKLYRSRNRAIAVAERWNRSVIRQDRRAHRKNEKKFRQK